MPEKTKKSQSGQRKNTVSSSLKPVRADSFRGFFQFLHGRWTPSRLIDSYLCATDIAKAINEPVMLMPLEHDEMIYMCINADHVVCMPYNGNTFAGALYTDLTRFPVPRFYHVRHEGDLMPAARLYEALKNRHYFDVKVLPYPRFAELIHEEGWKERLSEHRTKRQARFQDFEKLREGRYRNTTTDSALLLNTSGCIICGEPFEVIASATIAVPGENASISAVRLCSKHMEEAGQASSLMNYLAQAFNIPFIAESLKRTPQEVLSDGKRIMQEKLGMEVFDIGEEDIKAKTKNGTVLIYRYEHGLNYGYMINGPKNEQLMRIDSADHHRVEVGPDHLHPDLRNKLPPVPSYTMGDLCFDWPLIDQLINEWESTLVAG